MADAMRGFEGAIENTLRIAEMCDLNLDFSKRYSPVYRVPGEKLKRGMGVSPMHSQEHGRDAHATKPDDERYLRQLCEEGLVWRYGTRDVSKDIRERLDKELAVIASKNFC